MSVRRIKTVDREAEELITLMRSAFAHMEGRIDPPSSLAHMDARSLTHLPEYDFILAIGRPAVACVMASPIDDMLYLSKLAVRPDQARTGLGRTLIEAATAEARAANLSRLEVETRVELTENHRFFEACGFCETGRSAHPGFSSPTSIRFTRDL